MSDPSLAPVSEGDVLAKKYRVEKILGVGGMGVVVAATHLQLDQRVALKFLLPTMLYQGHIVQRFEREARAAARIKSEHVARVIDVGQLESGSPYMVMEFLEGEDLAQVLSRRGPLPVDEAVGFVLQACDAIAEAHSVGIVHRDLKPANLFLTRRPDKTSLVKVLDFGISKMSATGPEAQLTQTQGLLGSPLYMSPEQMTAPKTVDSRSDLWALGVIMFELLTGQTPFLGETMPELIVGILQGAAPSVAGMRPDVPPSLASVIAKCLEKEREARYRSVADLANALAPFVPPQWGYLPARIARVLGEDFVPVAAAPDALATAPSPPAVVTSTLLMQPVGPTLSGTAGTMSRSNWGAQSSVVDAPTPPVKPFPVQVVLAIGGIVLLAAAATGVWQWQGHRRASVTPTNPSPSAPSMVAATATATATAAIASTPPAVADAPLVFAPLTAPAADAGAGAGPIAIGARLGAPKAKPAAAAGHAPDPVPAPHAEPAQPAADPPNKMKMEWK